jgi:hypothetical protein
MVLRESLLGDRITGLGPPGCTFCESSGPSFDAGAPPSSGRGEIGIPDPSIGDVSRDDSVGFGVVGVSGGPEEEGSFGGGKRIEGGVRRDSGRRGEGEYDLLGRRGFRDRVQEERCAFDGSDREKVRDVVVIESAPSSERRLRWGRSDGPTGRVHLLPLCSRAVIESGSGTRSAVPPPRQLSREGACLPSPG